MKKCKLLSLVSRLLIMVMITALIFSVNPVMGKAEDSQEVTVSEENPEEDIFDEEEYEEEEYEYETEDTEETEDPDEETYDINLLSAEQTALNQITLTWEAVEGASYYRIYRREGTDGYFTFAASLEGADVTSWTDKDVKYGETYSYYMYYIVEEDYWWHYSDDSRVLSVTAGLMGPALKACAASTKSIKVYWDAMPDGIASYEIYRAAAADGEYSLVATVSSTETSWIDTGKSIGVRWYYKAIAVSAEGEKSSLGNYCSAYANVTRAVISSAAAKSGNSCVLKWDKVSYAKGYEICMSKTKTGTYKIVKTVTGNKTFTATVTGLTNGKTYYFKVRAYCTANGETYHGNWSSIRTKTINTYGYATESYSAKCKRIFGVSYYKEYSSAKVASKHMTTIRIKTWDINSKGKKYTRYWSLRVNKKIAPTVKKIFAKIYSGKEKFPIHDVGCYSWRGNSSSSEHCEGVAIDINPNENYFYDFANKKILAGKFWKPGKNAYSIPADGDVVKAMNQYGFTRGEWSTKTDYMHFSYFGT